MHPTAITDELTTISISPPSFSLHFPLEPPVFLPRRPCPSAAAAAAPRTRRVINGLLATGYNYWSVFFFFLSPGETIVRGCLWDRRSGQLVRGSC